MDSRFGYRLRHMHPCAFVALRRRWAYANQMTRTHEKVSHSPEGQGIEQAFKNFEGRWKLLILFHLFGGKIMRFSDLERAIPAISQKMLAQQLRRLEADGI